MVSVHSLVYSMNIHKYAYNDKYLVAYTVKLSNNNKLIPRSTEPRLQRRTLESHWIGMPLSSNRSQPRYWDILKLKIRKHIQRECQGHPGLNKSCAKGEDE